MKSYRNHDEVPKLPNPPAFPSNHSRELRNTEGNDHLKAQYQGGAEKRWGKSNVTLIK